MTKARTPGQIYVVAVDGTEIELPETWALPWVYGMADSRGERALLTRNLDMSAPDRTLRVQALQIGDAAGWFDYVAVRNHP